MTATGADWTLGAAFQHGLRRGNGSLAWENHIASGAPPPDCGAKSPATKGKRGAKPRVPLASLEHRAGPWTRQSSSSHACEFQQVAPVFESPCSCG